MCLGQYGIRTAMPAAQAPQKKYAGARSLPQSGQRQLFSCSAASGTPLAGVVACCSTAATLRRMTLLRGSTRSRRATWAAVKDTRRALSLRRALSSRRHAFLLWFIRSSLPITLPLVVPSASAISAEAAPASELPLLGAPPKRPLLQLVKG